MGYFSNGSEFCDWQERNCFRCAHWSYERGCPVAGVHFAYAHTNYQTIREIMHALIPERADGLANEQCNMLIDTAVDAAKEKRHEA